jgi:putative aldouronate transport system permease protein
MAKLSAKTKKSNRIKRSTGSKIFDIFNVFLMILIIIVIIYPFLNLIAISFSSAKASMSGKVTIWPVEFTTAAYSYIFDDPQVPMGFRNSVIYALGSVVATLVLTSLTAYPLSFARFKFKTFFTVLLTITMFFGGGMIPTYLLMRDFHLLDTVAIMILPGAVSAYNVFLFRTFFKEIPMEMRESAIIDGANEWLVLMRIYMPLSKPLLATFTLFSAVGSWNAWFNALIYLNDQKRYPLQLILRNYLYTIDAAAMQARAGSAGSASLIGQMAISPKSVRMAMVLVVILPIMTIYPFLQRYFVKGVMLGAVKG